MRTILSAALLIGWGMVGAQPQPGEVFREYHWLPSQVRESGKFLRVGGRLNYISTPDHFPADAHREGYIPLLQPLYLENATNAEVIIEKVLSHEGTRGLAIQINGQEWLSLPEADSLPDPAWDYMHHLNTQVSVPLSYLKEGAANEFRLRVDTTHYWDWPQHLIYGVTFRIYYDQASPWAETPSPVQAIPTDHGFRLSLDTVETANIVQVDYVGYYEDADWEGNGQYRQWHAHFHRGQLSGHIGSSSSAPFVADWSTDWLPDQPEPMRVYARLTTADGLIYATAPLNSLVLSRDGFSVVLCKPTRQPPKWVTRAGEFSAHFTIQGDLQQADAYQLIWTSWSPCYSNGILLNDHLVYFREDPCYDAKTHIITLQDTRVLHRGDNVLTTLKTPLFQGEMVHGMEVQWPGIIVKVRYDLP